MYFCYVIFPEGSVHANIYCSTGMSNFFQQNLTVKQVKEWFVYISSYIVTLLYSVGNHRGSRKSHQGWGLLSQFPPFLYFASLSVL